MRLPTDVPTNKGSYCPSGYSKHAFYSGQRRRRALSCIVQSAVTAEKHVCVLGAGVMGLSVALRLRQVCARRAEPLGSSSTRYQP